MLKQCSHCGDMTGLCHAEKNVAIMPKHISQIEPKTFLEWLEIEYPEFKWGMYEIKQAYYSYHPEELPHNKANNEK